MSDQRGLNYTRLSDDRPMSSNSQGTTNTVVGQGVSNIIARQFPNGVFLDLFN